MAKDFWRRICEDFDYRFFCGIPFPDIANLYKTMNADMMHYIPAAHENIAVKMATGTWISGFKSAVLLDQRKLESVDLSFNFKYKVPLLFITGPIKSDLFTSEDLEEVDSHITKHNKPAIFVYK
jgi:sulfopyruvate decarboxylase TPP-binding subunit